MEPSQELLARIGQAALKHRKAFDTFCACTDDQRSENYKRLMREGERTRKELDDLLDEAVGQEGQS